MEAWIVSTWRQAFCDATARKPSGWLGRLMYRKPAGHYGFFRSAVDRLQLGPEDVFLELGCGGGILLDMVSPTVQRACGIDHSPDMAEVAKEKNGSALSEGRVGIIQGDFRALPWAEETFTCVAGVEVLPFVEDVRWAFRELHRVLKADGRLVLITGAEPESRLSRWVSSPWLGYVRFHSNDELASALEEAGFETREVEKVDGSEHAASAHQFVWAVK
jgi:ubiquinone/menaquinone biosynthesis C-methylase UbiE